MDRQPAGKPTRLGNARGQNVIEYLLVTAIVMVVAIAFMNPRTGPMKNTLENVFNSSVDDLNRMRYELKFGN